MESPQYDGKYYNKIQGNSDEKDKERQDLLQVVQHYRKENPDLLKASLAKIYMSFYDMICLFMISIHSI